MLPPTSAHRNARNLPLPPLRLVVALLAAVTLLASPLPANDPPEPLPNPLPGLQDERPLVLTHQPDYDPDVPTLVELLGEEVGNARRPATPAQIETVLAAWQDHPRLRVREYARSHQDRPLHYAVITSERNLDRLDAIQEGWIRLADPRDLDDPDARELLESLPPVAWLAYSIHGNETTGADAAIALIYHLIADRSPETVELLDQIVVVVDPLMNPDGRERYLNIQRDTRSRTPAVDDQDVQVRGEPPGGRTNHYLFDLNRDWIYAVHPETRGRLRLMRDWFPLVFVDAHEMGSQDTYLFSPGREPINPHIPEVRHEQWALFGADHGRAFDREGWRHYSGEWHEEWYPGYSSSWASYRGGVGILYEQSNRGAVGVRRPEGWIATYRDGVRQQLASSLANLHTLRDNRQQLGRQFLDERRANVAEDHPFAERVFVFPPTSNITRGRQFADLLKLQGFELYVLTEEARVPDEQGVAFDRFGRDAAGALLPAGTLLVPNRQPHAPLVSAMLEFDTRLSPEFLRFERQSLLRGEGGKLYDVSSWSLPMYHDLRGFEARIAIPEVARRLEEEELWPLEAPSGGIDRHDAAVGYVIPGDDDRSVAAAGRLAERGIEVKLATRPFRFGGRDFSRGSLVISRQDNQLTEDWVGILDEVTRQLELPAIGIDTGAGEPLPTDEPDPVDFGGGLFERVEPPRIALITRSETFSYSAGEAWHTIDQRLGLRATYLSSTGLRPGDLRRYNVIVLPDASPRLVRELRDELRSWVEAGGTLIAIGSSAAALCHEEHGIGSVRLLESILADDKAPDLLDAYEQQVLREIEAELLDDAQVDPEVVFARGVPGAMTVPWSPELRRPPIEQLRRIDGWQRLFAPSGVVLGARVDERHWLTSGLDGELPVLKRSDRVMMVSGGARAPIRFGVVEPAANGANANADPDNNRQEAQEEPDPADPAPPEGPRHVRLPAAWPTPQPQAPAAWVRLPEGMEMRLRMSGLIWPEFAARVAHAPVVTVERVGRGQVILFDEAPAFRGATRGTMRIFTNAMVYGPGAGTTPPIIP